MFDRIILRSSASVRNSSTSVDRSTAIIIEMLEDYIRGVSGSRISKLQHLVAYSGGVDSSVVAALVHRVYGDSGTTKVVLGVSPSLPSLQRQLAHRVAKHIQIPLQEVHTEEGSAELYIKNEGKACYACKTSLYSALLTIYNAHGNDDNVILYNGTNADDALDSTRLGILAAKEFKVISPLLALSVNKYQVRQIAAALRLPNAHFAASPCLRSRLALGVEATPLSLQNIEQAETLVRDLLMQKNLLFSHNNMRVRHLKDGSARIELDDDILRNAEALLPSLAQSVAMLGYTGVHFKVFKSGSNAN